MSQKSVKNFAARWRLNPVIDLNSLQNLFCYELFCQNDNLFSVTNLQNDPINGKVGFLDCKQIMKHYIASSFFSHL